MPTLCELQAMFRHAMFGAEVPPLVEAIAADGLTPAARLQIYRHHVLTSLTEALQATFPVVCRLVDARFFGYAADTYIRQHPPEAPCLCEYGAPFSAFLATFPPCRALVYLADVARLEWALNVALHAEACAPIAPDALLDMPGDEVAGLTEILSRSHAVSTAVEERKVAQHLGNSQLTQRVNSSRRSLMFDALRSCIQSSHVSYSLQALRHSRKRDPVWAGVMPPYLYLSAKAYRVLVFPDAHQTHRSLWHEEGPKSVGLWLRVLLFNRFGGWLAGCQRQAAALQCQQY